MDKQTVPPRIVVVETVYHQQEPDPATMVESRFSRFLSSEDSPLIRRTSVGEEWSPLCCAGIEMQGSMLVIQNLEGRVQVRVPTEEEKKATDIKVLVVGIHSNHSVAAPVIAFANIRPGESMRLSPNHLRDYRIACISGMARYALALFPI